MSAIRTCAHCGRKLTGKRYYKYCWECYTNSAEFYSRYFKSLDAMLAKHREEEKLALVETAKDTVENSQKTTTSMPVAMVSREAQIS